MLHNAGIQRICFLPELFLYKLRDIVYAFLAVNQRPDKAARRNGAGADVLDIVAPDTARAIYRKDVRDRIRTRIDDGIRTEQENQRNQDAPADDAADEEEMRGPIM